MIESISITDVASYPKDKAEELTGLSQFNYLYGANGTGKSTIGRVIADEERHHTCKSNGKEESSFLRWFTTAISWNGTSLNPLS